MLTRLDAHGQLRPARASPARLRFRLGLRLARRARGRGDERGRGHHEQEGHDPDGHGDSVAAERVPNTTMPAGIAEALPAIAVTAINGTAGPIWSERADAKKATTPPAIATYRYGLSRPSATVVSIFPLSAFTATWVVVKRRPAASPRRMPWGDFDGPGCRRAR